jgi:hypothetical protein
MENIIGPTCLFISPKQQINKEYGWQIDNRLISE